MPLKGFEVGEQRSLQRLRPPPRPRSARLLFLPMLPPSRERFVGQEGCHVQGSPVSRGVRDPAVVLPRQAAAIGCAIAGLVWSRGQKRARRSFQHAGVFWKFREQMRKITHLGDAPNFAAGAPSGSRRDSDVRRTPQEWRPLLPRQERGGFERLLVCSER